jgi:S-adenosylmethionine-dependent methyltransferase
MKLILIKLLKTFGLYKTYVVPDHIKKNFIELDTAKYFQLNELILDYCKPEKYVTEEDRSIDIDALLMQRLFQFRETHIPFLIENIGLKNKSILEIGCGTGSSTLALAEQGAVVTGIDINENAMTIARKRLELYGLNPSFLNTNSADIKENFSDKKWDIIIFFASLEHMTPEVRKRSLKDAYTLLNNGGHLCVFGTPNRLWPFDFHTSHLPFYMWLQDELALDYSVFSSRKEFSLMHENNIHDAYDTMYSWGRGVSFHEFEVAIKKASELKVIGSLQMFLTRHSIIQKLSYKLSSEYKFKKLLSEFGPKNIHPGFYESYMDLIIEKN